jgi:hypothetical protein
MNKRKYELSDSERDTICGGLRERVEMLEREQKSIEAHEGYSDNEQLVGTVTYLLQQQVQALKIVKRLRCK